MTVAEEIRAIVVDQSLGQVTEAQVERLEQLVMHSDAARRLYVQYVRESASLRWWAERAPHNSERDLAQQIVVEAVESALLAQERRRAEQEAARQREAREARERSRLLGRWRGEEDTLTPIRHIVIPRVLAYGVAGALAAMIAIAAWLMMPDQPPPADRGQVAATAPTAFTVTLAKSVDAQWLDAPSLQPGAALPMRRMQLLAGWVELVFPDGASVMLQGPAAFEVPERDRLLITEGRLTARVPMQAIGFTVDTPRSRIVDLGTEFGVLVNGLDLTQVHVFAGEVELHPDARQDANGLLVQAGEAMSVAPDLSVHSIQLQREVFPYSAEAFLDRNLVVNGDFEADAAGVTISEQKWTPVEITGWNKSDSKTTTLNYRQAAKHKYPDPTVHPMPLDRGARYFAGMVEGTAWQSVSLGLLGGAVDRGAVRFEMGGWLGGFAANPDPITFTAIFLDRQGNECGRSTLGPVTPAQRNFETGFVSLAAEGEVPPGTRTIRLELETRHAQGNVVDGYADNLLFILRTHDADAPFNRNADDTSDHEDGST